MLLFLVAPGAGAVAPQRLTWEELPQLVGKHVSIGLYEGGAVAGKVRTVEPDALVIAVSKSSNPGSYPKGELRVPRATLYVLDLHRKGFRYRVLCTVAGLAAGTAAGAAVAFGGRGGRRADAALAGMVAGVGVTGYALGNSADRRTATIRIVH
jgi:hypothetical protein